MSEFAIRVDSVSKKYKLYDNNKSRVLDALGWTRTPKYHEHFALQDVSFDIKTGECIGIIGTNGAGKSTILKIITGVLNPTEGNVEINGRISALLELGAGFNMEYTGIENIYLNGTMIGFSREEIDARMQDILDFADIGDYVYQPVKMYSSGMFVRLAFAVAINIDPEILIVDEALSVGDVFFQAKCYRKFDEFKKQGKTILFVSHDLGSISKYCDRAILLDHGHKRAEGSPKEMINLYKRIMLGQDVGEELNTSVEDLLKCSGAMNVKVSPSVESWRSYYQINPEVDEYGNGMAEIIDFAVRDNQGTISDTIEKGTTFSIVSKVHFLERIQDPIFTFTLKNIQGIALTGTNTMYEGVDVGVVEKGDTYECVFSQEMNLQGGDYLLSISCTGYRDGEFTAYHRLYDVINLTVISAKNTTGYYDMNSQVELRCVSRGGKE